MNTGGPAFPTPEDNQFKAHDGMSLRDYFAAKAMTGIVGATANERLKPASAEEAAHWAYMIADAMIKCREKPLAKSE